MRYCDCPVCPCNIPVDERGKRDCRQCRAGNHMDARGERPVVV